MLAFACAGCGAVLTAKVSRVELPDHAGQKYGHDLVPALLEPGTYTVDPGNGRPWRPETPEEEGGVRLLTLHLDGPPGRIGLAPGDVRGTVVLTDRLGGCCCGWDGRYGPNLACAGCGGAVATRVDDCGHWQVVWLEPDAVRPVAVEGPVQRVMDWTELPGPPPVEPAGCWSPVWEAAIAASLAHLVVASEGRRVTVPDGPVAWAFRPAIDGLLPRGLPERRLALAGPGVPEPVADLALVPRHPQTGAVWPGATAAAVPLAAGVWARLAFADDRRLLLASPRMPDGVRRDDPPPPLPHLPFRPDGRVFAGTLERLGATREPWLRRIHDRVRDAPFEPPFG
ncbi:hypothetical protein [Nonomuraea sp. NPDC003214]